MGTLSYFANPSADGYTVDADGRFGWATPTDARLSLRLVDTRAFANGAVYLRYAPR